LSLSVGQTVDLGALSKLTQLEELRLEAVGNPDGPPLAMDIAFVDKLRSLRKLHLSGMDAESLSPLAGLTRLESLTLGEGLLVDVALLGQLRHLVELQCDVLAKDSVLSVLGQLRYLRTLNLTVKSPGEPLSPTQHALQESVCWDLGWWVQTWVDKIKVEL
jgi:Leucine-rich repeat (LRR) protein